jgi:hypothetical protein
MADEAKSWEKLMVAIDRGEEGVVATLLKARRCRLSTATAVSWLTGLGLGPYVTNLVQSQTCQHSADTALQLTGFGTMHLNLVQCDGECIRRLSLSRVDG